MLRDIRQLMRLVDDHRVRARQQLAEAAVLQRKIREQQVMIHDHHVRGLRFAARLGDEAAVVEAASRPKAIVDGRSDRASQPVVVPEVLELGQVAACARAAPGCDRAELGKRRRVARALVQRGLDPMPAQVVAAALQQRDAHRPAEQRAEQRQVACE